MKAFGAPVGAISRSVIFLLGPPGVGKTSLGSLACKQLGLSFHDFGAIASDASGDGYCLSDRERLSALVSEQVSDVIELPWRVQHDRQSLVMARQLGVLLLLWAHPEDMQARSGHPEPLFTSVPRLKIRGGFGSQGTGCREFRQLDRSCGETLFLVDLPFDHAAQVVTECIAEIRKEMLELSPVEREGLAEWEDDWCEEYHAPPRVAKVITQAMARYLAHLRSNGASARTLSGIRSDLNAAGLLVLMYDNLRRGQILEHFDGPPREIEFERKFTDSPALVARYRRSLEGFARFLKERGDVPKDDTPGTGSHPR